MGSLAVITHPNLRHITLAQAQSRAASRAGSEARSAASRVQVSVVTNAKNSTVQYWQLKFGEGSRISKPPSID